MEQLDFGQGERQKFRERKWFLWPDRLFQQGAIRPRIFFLSLIGENLRHCMLVRAGEEGAGDDEQTENEVDSMCAVVIQSMCALRVMLRA